MYTHNQSKQATLKYFNGNELATDIWLTKYALKNNDGMYLELTPDDTHRRLAKEFARVSQRYNQDVTDAMSEYGQKRPPLTEERIFELFKNFDKIIPQGSILSVLGDTTFVGSLSNCVVIPPPHDSYGGIMYTDQQLTQLMKRRCVGENTKVFIEGRGIVKIANVEIGDNILGFDPQQNRSQFLPVLDKWETRVAPEDKILIKTNTGTHLSTSKKHPILTLDKQTGQYKYVLAGNLVSGDILIKPEKSESVVFTTNQAENDIAWYIGAYLGDGNSGSLRYGYRIRLVANVREFVKKFGTISNWLSGSKAQVVSKSTRKDYKSDVWEYVSAIKTNEDIVNEFFDGQTGNKTYTAFIPRKITLSTMPAFLAGLYDADGYVKSKGSIVISSVSGRLIDEIGERLSALGVDYSIGRYSSRRPNEAPMNTVTIKDWNFIEQMLPHIVSSSKKEALAGSSRHSKKYFLTPQETTTILGKYEALPWGTRSNRLAAVIVLLKQDKRLGKGGLLELKENNIISNTTYNNILQRDTVRSIEKDSTKKHYDIKVESFNNFYAGNGGFAVIHNCGVGFDISTLRPAHAPVSNVAKTSTGATSFMARFSNTTREVAQNGRRGALMLTLDCRHPDIEDFIKIKLDRKSVTGANISVMWTNDFMTAVANDTDYVLRWPVDSPIADAKITKKVKAKAIWDLAVASAHDCAEPGMIFIDTMRANSTCDPYQPISSCNPCQPGFATLLTRNGVSTFDKINIGDEIWSNEGWTRVTNKWPTGTKPVFAYKTTAGMFIGTETHRIVTQDGKLPVGEADELHIIGGPSVPYKFNWDQQTVMDGLMIGDGSVHMASAEKVYLIIGENDQSYFDDPVATLIKNPHAVRYGKAWTVDTTISVDELPHTYHRTIPDRFFYGNRKTIASFLRGLYSANGSVVNNSRITLKTTSKKLLDQVQIMLSALGIRSYYTTNQPTWIEHHNGTYQSRISYDLNITSDRNLFAVQIGFIQPYKQAKLTQACTKNASKKEKYHDIINVEYLGEYPVYDITVDNKSHTYWTGGINVSNCAEIAMGPNDTCRLIALNMFSAVKHPFTDDAYFDFNEWYELAYEGQVLSDDLVELEIEHIQRILDKVNKDPEPAHIKAVEIATWENILMTAKMGRRTGLGITGLGDTLAALGLPYDQGLTAIKLIMSTKMQAEWDATTDLAIQRGPMPLWADKGLCETNFTQMLAEVHPNAYQRMLNHGRRNISVSTIAPTGSISNLAKIGEFYGVTSGIEPLFAPWYTRRKKVLGDVPDTQVDFVDDLGDRWQHFKVFHSGLRLWAKTMGIVDIVKHFDKSPYFNADANNIDWVRRVEIQAICQQYVTHSISSTINLPNNIGVDTVGTIYQKAYEMGLKGVTVYVDGSRDGVLLTDNNTVIAKTDAPKRPVELPGKLFNIKYYGNWVVAVGYYGDDPFEVFAFRVDTPIKFDSGTLVKLGGGHYNLHLPDRTVITDITAEYNGQNETALTRLLSLALRHGADLKYVVSQLDKSKESINSFAKVIYRVLQTLTEVDMDKAGACPDCGAPLVRQEGCKTCLSCGYSACA